MVEFIEMEVKVNGAIVFLYSRPPGDFSLNDVFITLKEVDYQKDKSVVLGVK